MTKITDKTKLALYSALHMSLTETVSQWCPEIVRWMTRKGKSEVVELNVENNYDWLAAGENNGTKSITIRLVQRFDEHSQNCEQVRLATIEQNNQLTFRPEYFDSKAKRYSMRSWYYDTEIVTILRKRGFRRFAEIVNQAISWFRFVPLNKSNKIQKIDLAAQWFRQHDGEEAMVIQYHQDNGNLDYLRIHPDKFLSVTPIMGHYREIIQHHGGSILISEVEYIDENGNKTGKQFCPPNSTCGNYALVINPLC